MKCVILQTTKYLYTVHRLTYICKTKVAKIDCHQIRINKLENNLFIDY